MDRQRHRHCRLVGHHRFQSEATRADLIIHPVVWTQLMTTRHASSAFFNPTHGDQMAMNHLEAYCKRRQRTMTPEMTIMAMLHENNAVIPTRRAQLWI